MRAHGKQQVRLLRHLLDSGRYDVRVRPVRKNEQPVDVHVRMNLYQLIDVVTWDVHLYSTPRSQNEPTQIVEIYVWTTQVCVRALACADRV